MVKYRKALLALFVTSLSILISSKTVAGLTGSFKVSKNSAPSDQRRTVSSGSRSSCQPSIRPRTLELLVPEQKVIHRTSKKNPTFYIYSRTTKLIQADFILTDLSKTQPTYQKQITIDSVGVKPISLPPEVQLEEKKHYTWNLAIPCLNDPDRYQTVLSAGVEYFRSPTLARQIDNAKSVSEEIQIYASNGVWYQAIDLAINYRDQLGYKNNFHTFNAFFFDDGKN